MPPVHWYTPYTIGLLTGLALWQWFDKRWIIFIPVSLTLWVMVLVWSCLPKENT